MKIDQATTACDHFHLVAEPNSHAQRLQIVEYMQTHLRKPDWTIAELAHGLVWEKSTVSARRNEMLKLFTLERGEKRHCSITGVHVETVKLKPHDQLYAFAQLARDMGV
jgi:hypothetical protein